MQRTLSNYYKVGLRDGHAVKSQGIRDRVKQEIDALYEPLQANGQTRQLKQGVTRAEAQAALNRQKIIDDAQHTPYQGGRTAETEIDQLISEGFIHVTPKPAGRIELRNDKGESLILRDKVLVDYYKLVTGKI